MNSSQTEQLIGLRDVFRRNRSQLESSVIKDYMADFLHDSKLRKLLLNDVSARAVWYCLCNNNADRAMLIDKLYAYFTSKKLDEKTVVDHGTALELISMVMFLGGVDFQLNTIKIERRFQSGQQPPSSGSLSYSSSGSGNTTYTTTQASQNMRNWILAGAVLLAVVLVIVLISRSCSDGNASRSDSEISKMDLCRTYSGYIEQGGKQQQSVMRVTFTGDKFHVTVSPSSNQADKTDYTAKIDRGLFKLEGGPNLTIDKTKKKTKLHCEASRHHGKWYFESQ